MNSSELWAENFKSTLNCVRCREYKPTELYKHSGEKIDVANTTIPQLEYLVPYMDVWCADCEVHNNYRVRARGRLDRKLEAARMASLGKKAWFDPSSRNHVLHKDFVVDKFTFYEAAKDYPCQVCGKHYHTSCMEFHHLLPKYQTLAYLARSSSGIDTLIEEMEKCALLCANCHRYWHHSGEVLPLALWRYDDHKTEIIKKLEEV